jgi:hypothetical protein
MMIQKSKDKRASMSLTEAHRCTFSLKIVPISQLLTKSNNPNTNFRAFLAQRESNNKNKKKMAKPVIPWMSQK